VKTATVTKAYQNAADFLRGDLGALEPRVAIVLGSGLSSLANTIEHPTAVPFTSIPGFPTTSVRGHGASLVFGKMSGVNVIVQTGRYHLYEGHDPATIVLPIRVYAELGVETLIITNAAGGIRSSLRPPTLMLIADHINLMQRSPLVGSVQKPEPRFPDMSEPYDRRLRSQARAAARELGLDVQVGVYAGVLGPSYETPAEIRMLEREGADAVGMSTVPEVIAARARGLKVLGISTISNRAAGMTAEPLSHIEVLAAARLVKTDLEALVHRFLRDI